MLLTFAVVQSIQQGGSVDLVLNTNSWLIDRLSDCGFIDEQARLMYWHRLKAMGAEREFARDSKKAPPVCRQPQVARLVGEVSHETGTQPTFPELPLAASAPEVLRHALRKDSAEILAGRWKAFGYLNLEVDDPPRWHRGLPRRQRFSNGLLFVQAGPSQAASGG